MQEFDLYLSLLSRVLRLAPRQRVEIADELRDHLEERFHELLESGRSQDEAIRLALEELGDAAVLAADFTSVISLRRRRQLMRWTVRSIAALTAAILLSFALWPVQNQVAPAPAGAQPPGQSSLQPPEASKPGVEDAVAATEAKLAKKLDPLSFSQTSFREVLEYLSQQAKVDILIDMRVVQDEGINLDTLVTLQLNHTTISAKTALDLVLEQAFGHTLGYTVRDGLVYITLPNASAEVHVYNCRDLLPGPWTSSPRKAPSKEGLTPTPGGEIPGAIPGPKPGAIPGAVPPGVLKQGFGMGGMGMSAPTPGASSSEGEALISTITATVAPDTWVQAGGTGAISEFKGLLVVKQSQAIHREIRVLLEKLRSAASESVSAPTPLLGPSPDTRAPANILDQERTPRTNS